MLNPPLAATIAILLLTAPSPPHRFYRHEIPPPLRLLSLSFLCLSLIRPHREEATTVVVSVPNVHHAKSDQPQLELQHRPRSGLCEVLWWLWLSPLYDSHGEEQKRERENERIRKEREKKSDYVNFRFFLFFNFSIVVSLWFLWNYNDIW